MLELVAPHRRYHAGYLAAVDEFVAAGEAHHAALPAFPPGPGFEGMELDRAAAAVPARFGAYVDWLRDQPRPESPRPSGFVPYTELWMVVGGEYVGRISLRHELNDLLLTWGGHIGYSVRPSARRRGYATQALGLMLPRCADLGIDPVLITCDPDNEGSRRVIEGHGGMYQDSREGKRRYWVPSRAAVSH